MAVSVQSIAEMVLRVWLLLIGEQLGTHVKSEEEVAHVICGKLMILTS